MFTFIFGLVLGVVIGTYAKNDIINIVRKWKNR